MGSTMKRVLVIAATLMASPAMAEFNDFQDEAAAMTDLIKCPVPKITRIDGLPDLYGCIFPGAEVMKVFINASDDNQGTRNIKIMWNDWTKDVGYGIHSDKHIAEAWTAAVATKFAPEQVQEVLQAFHGNNDATIENERYVLKYTYSVGPAIDERLIVITSK